MKTKANHPWRQLIADQINEQKRINARKKTNPVAEQRALVDEARTAAAKEAA